jgi:AraC-like DNA-binding protein
VQHKHAAVAQSHFDRAPSQDRNSMISMRVVRTLVDSVAHAGISRPAFLEAARLEPARLDVLDARVPRATLYDLIALALAFTGDPAFGMHSAERLTNDALNPIAGLVAHASTLREALTSIQEFRRLLADQPSFHVYEDAGRVIAHCNSLPDEPLHVRRFMVEVTLVGLFQTIQRFGADNQIDHVAFEYSAPDYRHEYARVFQGRARFEQPFTGLCFADRLMAAPAPLPDAELHEALRVYAKRRIMHLTDRMSYAERVHDLLVWQRPPRDLTMDNVAGTLGISVRTLRRHLKAEGKSFPEVLSDALTVIAKTCLLDERRTIAETAYELGFSDNTGFHRAFKRWTGLTPSEFRRQHARRPSLS